MPILFKDMFYESYSLPPMEVRINFEALLLNTISPILIMICINLVTLYRKLSISPLSFLRRALKKKNNKRPVKLPDISFLSRFRLRVFIQNKSNYIMLFFGLFFASVILMFGLCIKPLINNYVDSIKSSAISIYVEAVFTKTSGYIPIYIPSYLFALTVFIGMVSYFVINFFHKKKVYSIDMAAALKNRE